VVREGVGQRGEMTQALYAHMNNKKIKIKKKKRERGPRGALGHQSSTLRGTQAHLSYRFGFLSTLWWEKGG
jgi:hypothetical protein